MADAPVAVVTGGASGFGFGLAACCAQRGMRVALLDLDASRSSDQAAALAGEHGVEAFGLGVDVAKADTVDAAAGAVDERWGRADVVFSNVGVQLFGAVEAFTDDEWRWVLDVNVVGSARVARAFLPLLRRAPHGRLAFTTSSSVLDPASRLGGYQATKFAVWGLAETLRLELRDEPVTVSTIFPSGMITRHLETSADAQPDHLRRDIGSEADFTDMVESNPGMTTALATPEEAAANVIEAVLAGERYVITHGDLVDPVTSRCADLRGAAEVARDR